MEIITRISQIFHQTKIVLFPLEESLGEDFMAEVQRGALKGFRLACGMAIVAGLSFALVYELIFPARSYELLPLMAAMVLVGMMGIVFSLTPSGKRHPRGLSLVVANAIGTLLTVSQLVIGSHTYGHFGGLSIILLVMATLGTLKPFSVLVSAIYIVGLYFSTGIFLDRSVGWPPPATFILPCAFLAFSGIIAVGLTVFFHRTRRTEFLLRDELSRALRVLQETQAQLLASEKALTQSQVVAALSHELNNPVGVIASNLATQEKWIQRIAEAFSLIPTNLDKVNKLLGIGQELNQGSVLALKRIRVMLERLREFTHLDEAETKYVDVNHELLTALEMVKSEIGTEVQIQKDLGTLPQIISKPGKLNLAFASLIRNALQAINQQGVIKLFSSHKNGNVEITD